MPTSDEIQRYHWTSGGMQKGCEDAFSTMQGVLLVKAADCTAALEAQAEGHKNKILENNRLWGDSLKEVRIGHAADLAALRGAGESALMHFKHAALHKYGAKCMIHRDFRPTMGILCDIAIGCEVEIFVTHSMRRLNQKLFDKVVEEAERSNHHAGSAIDMNPVYQGVWYTSERMKDFDNLPDPVREFLIGVIETPELRWGGTFGVGKDEVHFDDNLVLRDPAEWQRRVGELNDE